MTPTLPLLPDVAPGAEVRDLVSPELWRRVANEIAGRHSLEGCPQPYATGSDLVCRVGEAVIKLAAPEWAHQIETEATLQAHLDGRLPFRVPGLIARGEFEGWPYLVMRRLALPNLTEVWRQLDERERVRLAAKLGEATAALHAVEAPALPVPSWGSFRQELRANLAQRLGRPGVPESLLDELEPFVRSVEPFPACGLVLLHTELLGEHVLVRETGKGWEVGGLIDFADGRAGHAEYDFVAPVEFVFQGQPGCLRAFLQGYGYPAEALGLDTQRRLLAWGLLHRYGSLPRMLEAAGGPTATSLDELVQRVYTL